MRKRNTSNSEMPKASKESSSSVVAINLQPEAGEALFRSSSVRLQTSFQDSGIRWSTSCRALVAKNMQAARLSGNRPPMDEALVSTAIMVLLRAEAADI